MIEVPLTQNKVAFVDEEDYELVSQYKWNTNKGRNTFYAATGLQLHRLVMENTLGRKLGSEELVDHINGNGLDNRRENLRVCSRTQNIRNRTGKSGSSKYKGVSWHTPTEKWLARIQVNKHQIHLGCFVNEATAAIAYDIAAHQYFGEFAKLNFPVDI
jgi:hypothetical protein